MPRVSLDIIIHKLSIYKEAWSVAQKKWKLGEEKRLATKNEAEELVWSTISRKPTKLLG